MLNLFEFWVTAIALWKITRYLPQAIDNRIASEKTRITIVSQNSRPDSECNYFTESNARKSLIIVCNYNVYKYYRNCV